MKLRRPKTRRRHVCPVCWQPVTSTATLHNPHRRIAGHLDKAGHHCPMSLEPYELTTIQDATT